MPKPAKQRYKIRNWKEYNAALKQRGKLTFWVNEEVRENWLSKEKTGRRGASPSYTDVAIATMGTIQSLFHLAGRQTQGFLESLFELIGVDLSVPGHSTLSRRLGKLKVELPIMETGFAHHVVVSTGVKVYGEGEWHILQHGNKERRTWRKLHLGVDEATGEILAAVVSTNNISDGAVLPELLPNIIGEIEQVSADGAYDQRSCYDAIANRQAQAAIPPRKGARLQKGGSCPTKSYSKNENLRRIEQIGRAKWQREIKYHRRSIVENTFSRLKVSLVANCGGAAENNRSLSYFSNVRRLIA